MSSAGSVMVFQGGMPALVDPSTLTSPDDVLIETLTSSLGTTNANLASAGAALTATGAALQALTVRVAALEGKPSPIVALTGQINPATIQIGTTILSIAVAGLLATDVTLVEPATDLPVGLSIGWAHPKAAGTLSLSLTAGAVISLSGAVILNIRVTRP